MIDFRSLMYNQDPCIPRHAGKSRKRPQDMQSSGIDEQRAQKAKLHFNQEWDSHYMGASDDYMSDEVSVFEVEQSVQEEDGAVARQGPFCEDLLLEIFSYLSL